jgi:aerobic-type carbon monoxide dehydrogenase small subunit (CoxS/CutS family)
MLEDMVEKIALEVNRKKIEVPRGITVAAAIFIAGETSFRTSISGQPRAALCGMGICMECRVTIDGRPHCRSCQILAQDGMMIATS